ncbi:MULTISPECIES: heavy metal translocating P-type ATPase [Variovorax]|jgi:Zn2+/Cd2+-exporting ATPase|uniref:heavy metal translocating P-type ATPase n=1 Tax=Variovorax TaxID=34072 RepID=UPI000B04415A|nr:MULTISPECIES: heavy metal translocating P-type ATPase [Variovorax]MBN8756300.1 heavy metal translocating P-type ATPase [Variovorax sp.]UKI10386.1 heavy metal translocating P-type ATPase [Variovorax paradoxus]
MNAMTQTSCGSSCGCSTGDVKTPTAEPVVTGFAIANMDCPSEEAQIRKRLGQLDGIQGMTFELAGRRLEVTHASAGQNAILRALHDIGMQAVVDTKGPRQVVYFIEQMDCPNEERQLRSVLEPLAGVRAVEFDLKAHTLTVSHTLSDTTSIARTIEGLGMKPVAKTGGDAPSPASIAAAAPLSSVAAPAIGGATRFFISNMDCPTEEATIRKRLGTIDGIEQLDFDLMNRRLDIQHHLPDHAPILKALNDVGMKASVEQVGGAESQGRAVYLIEKMDCPTEEGLLRKALEGMPGVNALSFNLMGRTLTVSHELADLAPVTAAIERLGMAPVLQSASEPTPSAPREFGSGISRGQWLRMAISGVLALGAEAMVFAGTPEASWPVILASLAAIGLGGIETLKKGWIALKTRSLNMNLLMTVAVIGAALIGQWPEAAVVIWLFGIAEMIEALSLDRARNAIRKLMDLAPESALVRQPDGQWIEVKADAVPVGGVVRVRPGERIALDGEVVAGQSSVNQAPITGESMPVEKAVGATVFAGTINERGTLEFRVTSRTGETTLDRIARSVQEAQGQRAPTQRFVDRFASIYTPAVFAVALAVAVIPPLAFGQPWFEWVYKALVMLVIACPCALVISTPVTVVSGLAAAARRGILVKGGLYLEQGRHLKSVALDKTGTLTHGRPALTDVIAQGTLTKGEALRLAASIDVLSEHPVATAIVAGHGDGALASVERFEAIPGRGVKGDVDGRTYYVGNHRLIEELGICSPELEAQLDALELQAKTAVVLATDREVLAVLGVADTVRETSRQAIEDLKSLGIEPVMLTGDNKKTAQAVATQVGITSAKGELLPQDKLQAIEELLTRGPVGMVGDGVNDAPALARSSIGFAMGAAGTDTAIETADVALMQDDLRKLPEFVRLSQRVGGILTANIVFALGTKAIFMVLAFTGHASLWLAILADMGASLAVVFNGLRLLRAPTAPQVDKR